MYRVSKRILLRFGVRGGRIKKGSTCFCYRGICGSVILPRFQLESHEANPQER